MTAPKNGTLFLGIDPGSKLTGFGVVAVAESRIIPVAYGTIAPPAGTPADDLSFLHREVGKILDAYPPECAAVERLYFSNNQRTAMAVSQARGVLLLALRDRRVSIHEPTPIQVKQFVTGYGKADKRQVHDMVQRLLHIQEKIRPDDAADALALAICASLLGRQRY